jgi:hypothetical protein
MSGSKADLFCNEVASGLMSIWPTHSMTQVQAPVYRGGSMPVVMAHQSLLRTIKEASATTSRSASSEGMRRADATEAAAELRPLSADTVQAKLGVEPTSLLSGLGACPVKAHMLARAKY